MFVREFMTILNWDGIIPPMRFIFCFSFRVRAVTTTALTLYPNFLNTFIQIEGIVSTSG